MAYVANDLQCIVPRMGMGSVDAGNKGMAIFSLRTDDTHAAVTAANYIDPASEKGVQDGDIVLAVVDEDGTKQGRVYYIANLDTTNDQADLVEITAT